MGNWKPTPGQKVICIKSLGPIVEGEIYEIAEVIHCSKCDKWHVTLECTGRARGVFTCSFCGTVISVDHKFTGCRSDWFAPIQEQYNDATAEILEKFAPSEGGKVDKKIKELETV